MSTNAFAPESSKPTVVLVHGAFAESSSWNGVVERLHAEGLPVVAVANPLRGLLQDAEYLRSVIDHIDGPVVVAGHSYGGSVLSEATEGADNVRALVYIASFLLEPDESTSDLAGKFPGGELGTALTQVPYVGGPQQRRRPLHRAGQVPSCLRRRRLGGYGGADGRDPTPDRRCRPGRLGHQSRVEEHSLVDTRHSAGPRCTCRGPAVHGGTRRLACSRDRRVPRRDGVGVGRRGRPDRHCGSRNRSLTDGRSARDPGR